MPGQVGQPQDGLRKTCIPQVTADFPAFLLRPGLVRDVQVGGFFCDSREQRHGFCVQILYVEPEKIPGENSVNPPCSSLALWPQGPFPHTSFFGHSWESLIWTLGSIMLNDISQAENTNPI